MRHLHLHRLKQTAAARVPETKSLLKFRGGLSKKAVSNRGDEACTPLPCLEKIKTFQKVAGVKLLVTVCELAFPWQNRGLRHQTLCGAAVEVAAVRPREWMAA